MFSKKDDPVREQRDLEGKLAKSRANRDGMNERLRTAEAAAIEFREMARKLAAEGADDVALAKAENAMRAQQDRAVTLRNAISDADTAIVGYERTIAAIIDQRMRTETSLAVEAMADALSLAAEAFEDIAKTLEDAAREASLIVLDSHALTSFVMSARQQLPAAVAVVVRELHGHAHSVSNGGASPSLPRAQPPEPARLQVVQAQAAQHVGTVRTVFSLRPLAYTVDGKLIRHPKMLDAELPVHLAAKAIEIGAACEIADPRRKQYAGTFGATMPQLVHCVALDGTKIKPEPSVADPIVSSHFEPHPNIGKPYTGTMPARPTVEVIGRKDGGAS